MMRDHPQPGSTAIVFRVAHKQRWRALVLGLALMAPENFALAQASWPTIALPKDVRAFDIGEQLTINGLPMRMQGFVSALKPVQLAEWFRQRMGKPLVENTLANKLILGRAQGEYYLTVQLEPAATGTRGIAAVSHLKAAYDERAENRASTEHWLSRFPAGSKLLSQMRSEDAGKVSTYLLVVNTQSGNLNRKRLKNLMRNDGFELEHEAMPDNKTGAALPEGIAHGKTLFFKGPGKEAMATIYRDNHGRTAIVLNTLTQMERFK